MRIENIKELEDKIGFLMLNSEESLMFIDTNYIIVASNDSIKDIFNIYFNRQVISGRSYFSISIDPLKEKEILKSVQTGEKEELKIEISDNTSFIFKYKPAIADSGIVGILITCKICQSSSDDYEVSEILESITDGFYALNKNWVVTYWNKEAESLLKISRKKILGRNLWQSFSEENKEKFYSEYKKAIDLQVSRRFEAFFTELNTWFEVSAYPTDKGLSVYFKDVTEKKKAVSNIKDSEEKRRLIMMAALDAIVCIDTLGLITFWNPQAERIFGWKEAEVLGKSLLETIIPSQFRLLHEDGVKKYLKTGDGSALNPLIELSAVNKVGEEFPVELTILPIKQGGEEFLCAFIRDITERKKAEYQLQKNNQQLLTAQQIAEVGYWELELKTNTNYWSEQVYKICGLQPGIDEIDFDSFLTIIHPEDRDAFLQQHRDSLDYGQYLDYEFKIVRPNGAVRNVLGKASIITDEAGNATRMICALQDITSLRAAEFEREKITADLIQRNKDLEQFAYIVSHNLRSPVANILGCIEIMNNPDFDRHTKDEMLGGLLKAAKKLDTVIWDLSFILQVKRDVQEKREEVRFSSIVDDIKVSISNVLREQNAEIKTDFSKLNTFETFKTYIYSIFYNLISNSIKYRRADTHPVIEITTIKRKNSFDIIFKDNGMGLNLENIGDKVFGLYKRFHNHIDGKGMGLFMVKTQVETLGGRISIESKVNEGTTFIISFEI